MFRKRQFAMFLALTLFVSPPIHAQGIGTTYDMSRFLSEPHPFATSIGSSWQPILTSQLTPAFGHSDPPRPPTSHAEYRASSKTKAKSGHLRKPGELDDRWLSEVRVGILKHAASLVGNTAKETGIDGNLEILFKAPSFLELLSSPRPTIGVTANASSTNTDTAYSGLTWELTPWSNLLLNVSLGMAVHNGELKFDPSVAFPANAGRHREFGCRWLFRESLEAGWLFGKHHAATIMWSHYSHGGLCDDKNEGLDNVGFRYGYRF